MATIRINGMTVEYQQAGSGPDLLLLHSLLTEMSVFERVLSPLARAHRVTRLNLPGFGASDAVELSSVGEHADHVARVMDALALPPTVDVFGNGFGALRGAGTGDPARRAHRPFDGGGHGAGISRAGQGAISRHGGKSSIDRHQRNSRHGDRTHVSPAFQAAHPDVVAARKAALAAADAPCFARACLALAALDLRPRLAGIRNPTLVMCGALDQTTPPALAREVASAISGAVYRDIEDSGHCPMLEQSEALVAMIESFTTGSASSVAGYCIVPSVAAETTPFIQRHGRPMTETYKLRVNGRECEVQAEPNTPLLYVLRNDLKLKGTRFGCGEGQCGACTVLFDGSCRAVVRHADLVGPRSRDHDHRRDRRRVRTPSDPAGVHRRAGGAMRLLHQRHHHLGRGATCARAGPERCPNRGRARSQSLPLRYARPDPACDSRGGARYARQSPNHDSRRSRKVSRPPRDWIAGCASTPTAR